jgi:predicted lipoprotein with Yx(FWY)xxD motif
VNVKRISLLAALPVVLALLAGCGSSNTNTSTTSASNAASTSTSSSGGGGAGPYGSAPASTTSTSSSAAPATVVISAKQSKLGTILATGSNRLTVYLFEADRNGSSACNGACASAWPPVTGQPQAGSGVSASQLGQITRSDGTKQVTYNGHPLYLFVEDKTPADTNGQGIKAFGAAWYVLSPSGSKVEGG